MSHFFRKVLMGCLKFLIGNMNIYEFDIVCFSDYNIQYATRKKLLTFPLRQGLYFIMIKEE